MQIFWEKPEFFAPVFENYGQFFFLIVVQPAKSKPFLRGPLSIAGPPCYNKVYPRAGPPAPSLLLR